MKYFEMRKIPVWGKLHVSEERYYDAAHKLVPISTRQGKRTYVMLHAYVLWPKLIRLFAVDGERLRVVAG